MQVQIEQSFGRLAIEQTDAQMDVSSSKADFELTKPPIILEISSEAAEIDIDYTAPLADMGIYDPFTFGEKLARDGMNDSMQGIANYARQGDQLGRIENSNEGDVIISQAVQNSGINDEQEIVLSPKRLADINIRPGEQSINIETGGFNRVNTDIRPNPVQVETRRHQIDIYLAERPEIEIQFIDFKA